MLQRIKNVCSFSVGTMGVAGLLSVVLPLCVVFLAVYLTRPTIPVSPKLITWRNDGKYFNFNGSPIFYKGKDITKQLGIVYSTCDP